MTVRGARDFVQEHGLVLVSARGALPNLVEALAGEPVRGSWWSHPRARRIYHVLEAVTDSPDVLVCRLAGGKLTLVHRRLWPALVRLAGRWPRARLAAVRDEHTERGSHRALETPFPRWVPADVRAAAARLDENEAVSAIGVEVVARLTARARTRRRARSPAPGSPRR